MGSIYAYYNHQDLSTLKHNTPNSCTKDQTNTNINLQSKTQNLKWNFLLKNHPYSLLLPYFQNRSSFTTCSSKQENRYKAALWIKTSSSQFFSQSKVLKPHWNNVHLKSIVPKDPWQMQQIFQTKLELIFVCLILFLNWFLQSTTWESDQPLSDIQSYLPDHIASHS